VKVTRFVSTRRDVLIGSAASTALALAPVIARGAGPRMRPNIGSPEGGRMMVLYALAVQAMQDPAINYPPQPQSWIFQSYIHGVPSNPFDPANAGGLFGPASSPGNDALKQRIDEIYGNPASGSPQELWKKTAMDCWATCTHASPYFATWHRWYLYYFERICRQMCRDQTFALPYWNYASDIGSSLQLPPQFQATSFDPSQPNPFNPPPSDSNLGPNHLYFDDRGLGFSDPQGTSAQNVSMNNNGYMPYQQIQYGSALGATNMFPSDDSKNFSLDPTSPIYLAMGFTGRLECAPHDNVHNNVGGWMANVPAAAGDPIFFVHHCQVDRLYASWAAQKGIVYNWGAGGDANDPDQCTWINRMASFVDEKGQLVTVKLGDAVTTEPLGYTYDKLAEPLAPAVVAAASALAAPRPNVRLTLAAMSSKQFAVESGGSTITLAPEANAAGRAEMSTNGAGQSPPHILTLHGLKLLRRPPAPLSVFLNMPKGAPPRLNNPYYVGTLNLFNFDLGTGGFMSHADSEAHHEHQHAEAVVRLDVTEVLQQQLAKGLWDGGPITVTISTIGADAPSPVTYLEIGAVILDH
jgi:tyrosinase